MNTSEHLETAAGDLPWKSLYKILIGSVLPRPIGWISTLSPDGKPNLAPFSFFNAVCAQPPTLLFCPDIRNTDLNIKDTLYNVRETGEFVVNIVSESLAQAMVQTSAELPAGVDEFEFAGLKKAPSRRVKPPRVADSLVHFECELREIIVISNQPGGGAIVIGEIVHLHVSPEVLIDGDKIDPQKLQPIGRMGGYMYCRTTDLFELQRPPSQIQRLRSSG
jgi:flavin reductase (DIM6/NTAB) family NADH-FMN oxidoreductase RutF